MSSQPQWKRNPAKWRAYCNKRWRENMARISDLKRGPCADCKAALNPWQMDFDHVRGVKKFNVSIPWTRSMKLIEAEIAKCELVCANCHRERTYRRSHNAN